MGMPVSVLLLTYGPQILCAVFVLVFWFLFYRLVKRWAARKAARWDMRRGIRAQQKV